MARCKLACKLACVAFLFLTLMLIPYAYKKPIEQATYAELIGISGIGEVRTHKILTSCVDDVDNLIYIDGIGYKLVAELKEHYR